LVSPGDVQHLEVTGKEREKLQFLRTILDGVHSFQDDFATYRTSVLASDGIKLDRKINWIGISNYLAPEVVLVTALSPDNAKDGFSGVWEYPIYAITMSGNSLDLKRPWVLGVKESRQRAKTDAVSMLNSLKGIILTFDERKKENCLMLLNRLQKIMVPKS
jgi:hypothetical protein